VDATFVDASTFASLARNPTAAASMVGPCGLSGADCCALDMAGSTARAHKLMGRKRISFSVEDKQKTFGGKTR
jgi:hypothetical protein